MTVTDKDDMILIQWGSAALLDAVDRDHPKVVSLLLSAGVDINHKTKV